MKWCGMAASNTPHARHSRSDLNLEQARDIRARALAYVFECHQTKQKKAAGTSGGEGSMRSTEEVDRVKRVE